MANCVENEMRDGMIKSRAILAGVFRETKGVYGEKLSI